MTSHFTQSPYTSLQGPQIMLPTPITSLTSSLILFPLAFSTPAIAVSTYQTQCYLRAFALAVSKISEWFASLLQVFTQISPSQQSLFCLPYLEGQTSSPCFFSIVTLFSVPDYLLSSLSALESKLHEGRDWSVLLSAVPPSAYNSAWCTVHGLITACCCIHIWWNMCFLCQDQFRECENKMR